MADKITKQDIEKAKEKLKAKKEEKPTETLIENTKKESEKSENIEKTEESKPEPRKERKERIGVLNIYTTFNNTIMSLTDMAGNSISKFSGGQSTKQDRLKANPTIAMFIAQKIAEEAKDNGITGFYVKIRAGTGQNNPGPGAHAAIKSLTRAGFKILSIIDTTRTARGGPKKKGGRRGRRV
jgi:small subunit ribosomal protein S11|tara:strand:+ start:8388 stop:8933 length:546 start_codon:yes stop_codon:yes gene_type:complete